MAAKGQIDPHIRDADGNIIPWKKRNREANNIWRKAHRAAGLESKPTTEQQRIWQSNHRIKNPRGQKNRYLRHKYGIDIIHFDSMHKSQDGKCDICKRIFSEELTPYVDHEHSDEGTVRGLLCLQCNTAIGNFKDDISLLKSAIDYLEKHRNG